MPPKKRTAATAPTRPPPPPSRRAGAGKVEAAGGGAGPSNPPPARRGGRVEVKADPVAAAAAPRPPLPAAAVVAGRAIDEDPIAFLTDDAAAFWANIWQKKATVFPATIARQAWVAACLPSTDALVDRAGVGDRPLLWGVDVVAARYADGARTDLNTGPPGTPATPADRRRLMASAGATLQVHHPQRWDDAAWRLVSAMERDLGCLVGTNAYLTPAGGAQGLAPHWDDVDVWVVQVEGKKAWRVYGPYDWDRDARLRVAPSGDLKPTRFRYRADLEVTLSPGDVLYIPRGTVHQAATLEGEAVASCHLTISAFQAWTVADLAVEAVRVAAGGTDEAPLLWSQCSDDWWRYYYDVVNAKESALTLRSSLAPGAVYRGGFGETVRRHLSDSVAKDAGWDLPVREAWDGFSRPPGAPRKTGPGGPPESIPAGTAPPDAAGLAAALRAIADTIDRPPAEWEPSLYDAAVDAFSTDFFASRVPPYPTQVADAGPAPSVGSRMACRAPRCFRLMKTANGAWAVTSCLNNPRATHMVQVGGEEPDSDASSSSSSDNESEDNSEDDSDSDEEAPDLPNVVYASAKFEAEPVFTAAALAATADSPVEVVATEVRMRIPPAGTPLVIPISLRLATELWQAGILYVVLTLE